MSHMSPLRRDFSQGAVCEDNCVAGANLSNSGYQLTLVVHLKGPQKHCTSTVPVICAEEHKIFVQVLQDAASLSPHACHREGKLLCPMQSL